MSCQAVIRSWNIGEWRMWSMSWVRFIGHSIEHLESTRQEDTHWHDLVPWVSYSVRGSASGDVAIREEGIGYYLSGLAPRYVVGGSEVGLTG